LFSIKRSTVEVHRRVGSFFHGDECSELNTATLPLLIQTPVTTAKVARWTYSQF